MAKKISEKKTRNMEIANLSDGARRELEDEFYSSFEVMRLFTPTVEAGLEKFIPWINIAISFVVLLVLFTKK